MSHRPSLALYQPQHWVYYITSTRAGDVIHPVLWLVKGRAIARLTPAMTSASDEGREVTVLCSVIQVLPCSLAHHDW